jgi:hypothetical protein
MLPSVTTTESGIGGFPVQSISVAPTMAVVPVVRGGDFLYCAEISVKQPARNVKPIANSGSVFRFIASSPHSVSKLLTLHRGPFIQDHEAVLFRLAAAGFWVSRLHELRFLVRHVLGRNGGRNVSGIQESCRQRVAAEQNFGGVVEVSTRRLQFDIVLRNG